MKAVDQNILLSQLTKNVEEQLAEVYFKYKDAPCETLLMSSSTGGWSIAQCLDHLNSYLAWYNVKIGEVLIASDKFHGSKTFKSGWLGSYLTNMMKEDAGRKKYKAMARHLPGKQLNALNVVETFLANQEILLKHIKRARSADLEQNRVSTTISGFIKLKLGDALAFMVAHQERHLVQARRNYAE